MTGKGERPWDLWYWHRSRPVGSFSDCSLRPRPRPGYVASADSGPGASTSANRKPIEYITRLRARARRCPGGGGRDEGDVLARQEFNGRRPRRGTKFAGGETADSGRTNSRACSTPEHQEKNIAKTEKEAARNWRRRDQAQGNRGPADQDRRAAQSRPASGTRPRSSCSRLEAE
jgi:hypothetical protein